MANIEETRQVYDDSQIQVLEGLEAVRRRPGMYIGSTSLRGLHHLVYEIVDNSIDEALAGRCSHIEVTLLPDGSVSVQDDGQGIPGGIHPKMGIPTLEVILTVLHAGGKFDGNGYEFSGGLHGVGSSVVNALSEWIELESCYQGRRYTERFERGAVARPFCDEGPTEKHGLYVRFKPDPTIFDEVVFEIFAVTATNQYHRYRSELGAALPDDFFAHSDYLFLNIIVLFVVKNITYVFVILRWDSQWRPQLMLLFCKDSSLLEHFDRLQHPQHLHLYQRKI